MNVYLGKSRHSQTQFGVTKLNARYSFLGEMMERRYSPHGHAFAVSIVAINM